MRSPKLTGSRCLCRACGERFNSTAAFDRHRVDAVSGFRRCLTAEEITRRGIDVPPDLVPVGSRD
jgi:hypothetical protein